MPSFRYQAISPDGSVQAGTLAAPDRASALKTLSQRGETPLEIEMSPADAAAASGRRFKRPSIARAELADLVRELATALEAGLPLMQALRTVRKQAASKTEFVVHYSVNLAQSAKQAFADSLGPALPEQHQGRDFNAAFRQLRPGSSQTALAEQRRQPASLCFPATHCRPEFISCAAFDKCGLLGRTSKPRRVKVTAGHRARGLVEQLHTDVFQLKLCVAIALQRQGFQVCERAAKAAEIRNGDTDHAVRPQHTALLTKERSCFST
jgi:hypothetical protein